MRVHMKVWTVAALAAAGLGAPLVLPATAGAPALTARAVQATADAAVTLDAPRQALGAEPVPFPTSCEPGLMIDCPIHKPASIEIAPVPDQDGDGRKDVLSRTVNWTEGKTTFVVATGAITEPVAMTTFALHGPDGAVRWRWEAGANAYARGYPLTRHGVSGAAPGLLVQHGTDVTVLEGDGRVRWERRSGTQATLPVYGAVDTIAFAGFVDVTGAADDEIVLLAGVSTAKRLEWLIVRAADASVVTRIPVNGNESLRPAGDLDGDGFGDVLLTSRDYSAKTSRARAVSGKDASQFWSVEGDDPLGTAYTPAGDLNGDGAGDLYRYTGYYLGDTIVQAPNLTALVGRTGAVLWGAHAGFVDTPVFADLDRDGSLELVTQRFVFVDDAERPRLESRYIGLRRDGTVAATAVYAVSGTPDTRFYYDTPFWSDSADVDGDGTRDFGHLLWAYDDSGLIGHDERIVGADGSHVRTGPLPDYLDWTPALRGSGLDIQTDRRATGALEVARRHGVSDEHLVELRVEVGGHPFSISSLAADVDGDGYGELVVSATGLEDPPFPGGGGPYFEHTRALLVDGRTGQTRWELAPLPPPA